MVHAIARNDCCHPYLQLLLLLLFTYLFLVFLSYFNITLLPIIFPPSFLIFFLHCCSHLELSSFLPPALLSSLQRNPTRRRRKKIFWIFMASFAGTTQKCMACDKTVYLVDKLTADNRIYHKACFRCHHCKGTLKVRIYFKLVSLMLTKCFLRLVAFLFGVISYPYLEELFVAAARELQFL